ncbi:hypothetical protein MXB_5261 [Myxobolus squamalis]|nr:hypothetical protein MXB_5261 [Myxobolus squamalis]
MSLSKRLQSSNKEISESLCLSLKAVYKWTKKLLLESADQNDLENLKCPEEWPTNDKTDNFLTQK